MASTPKANTPILGSPVRLDAGSGTGRGPGDGAGGTSDGPAEESPTRRGKPPKSKSPVIGRSRKRRATPDLTDLFGPDSPDGGQGIDKPEDGVDGTDNRAVGPDGRPTYEGWAKVKRNAARPHTPPTAKQNGDPEPLQSARQRMFELTPEMCVLDTSEPAGGGPTAERPRSPSGGPVRRPRASVPDMRNPTGPGSDPHVDGGDAGKRARSGRRYARHGPVVGTNVTGQPSVISQSSAADSLASTIMGRLRDEVGGEAANLDDAEIAKLMVYAKRMKRDRLRTEMQEKERMLEELESPRSDGTSGRRAEFSDVRPAIIGKVKSPRTSQWVDKRRARASPQPYRPARPDGDADAMASNPTPGGAMYRRSRVFEDDRSPLWTETEDEFALGTSMKQLYHELIWEGAPAGMDLEEVLRIMVRSYRSRGPSVVNRPPMSADRDAIAWAEYLQPVLHDFAAALRPSPDVIARGLLNYHHHGPTRPNGGPKRWDERDLGRGLNIQQVYDAVESIHTSQHDDDIKGHSLADAIWVTLPEFKTGIDRYDREARDQCPGWATAVRDAIVRYAADHKETYQEMARGIWAYHFRSPARGPTGPERPQRPRCAEEGPSMHPSAGPQTAPSTVSAVHHESAPSVRSGGQPGPDERIALGTTVGQLYHDLIWRGVPAGIKIQGVLCVLVESPGTPVRSVSVHADGDDVGWAGFIRPVLLGLADGVDASFNELAESLLAHHRHGPTRPNGGPATWPESDLGAGVSIRTIHRAAMQTTAEVPGTTDPGARLVAALQAMSSDLGTRGHGDEYGPDPCSPSWCEPVQNVLLRYATILGETFRAVAQGVWAYHHRRLKWGAGGTARSTEAGKHEGGGVSAGSPTPSGPPRPGPESTGPSTSDGAPPVWLQALLEGQSKQLEVLVTGLGRRGPGNRGPCDGVTNGPTGNPTETPVDRTIDDVHLSLIDPEHEHMYEASADRRLPVNLRAPIVVRPDGAGDYSGEDLHVVMAAILETHLDIRSYARVKTLATVDLEAIHYNSVDCTRTVPKPVTFDIGRMPALTGDFFADTTRIVDACTEAALAYGYCRRGRSQVLQIVYRGLVKRYLPHGGEPPKSKVPYVVGLYEMEQQAKHTTYEARMEALMARVKELEKTADKAFEHKASRELAISEADKLLEVYYRHPAPADGWRAIMHRLIKWCETRAAVSTHHTLELIGREDELMAGQLASCNAMLTERYTACLDRIMGAVENQAGTVPPDQTNRLCAVRAEAFAQALASLRDVPMDIKYTDRIEKDLVRYLPTHPRTVTGSGALHPRSIGDQKPPAPASGAAAAGGSAGYSRTGHSAGGHSSGIGLPKNALRDSTVKNNQIRAGYTVEDDEEPDEDDPVCAAHPLEDDLSIFDLPEVPLKMRYDWTTYKRDDTNPFAAYYRMEYYRMPSGLVYPYVLTKACEDRAGLRVKSGLCPYGPGGFPRRLCMASLIPHHNDPSRSACMLGLACPDSHLILTDEQICAAVKAMHEVFSPEETQAIVEAQLEVGHRFPAKMKLDKEPDPMKWASLPGNVLEPTEVPDWTLLDEQGRHVFAISTGWNVPRSLQPEPVRARRIIMPRISLPELCPPVDESVPFFRAPVA